MTKGQQKLAEYRRNPIQFVREQFQVEPDVWQAEALEAFGDQDNTRFRISLQACAGPGKTCVLAWCIWNFMLCYGDQGEHPKGAAVAVTWDNLQDNLWSECAKWQQRSPVLTKLFDHTSKMIYNKQFKETWFMSARSWNKKADENEQGRTLSGLHSKYVFCVIDESGDIPPAVLKAAEQALSNCKWGRIVQAGNPTSLEGMLYAAATKLRSQWKIIKITSDPDDPRRSTRVDIEWARQQIKDWGRDNPWVMAYILGQFPPSSLNTILGLDEVEKAMRRHLTADQYHHAQKRLGIDVARFGMDQTIIFPRQGLATFKPAVMRNARTNEIGARVGQAKMKWSSEMEFVDDTGGWGAGVIDCLIQAGHNPSPINFSSKATDPRYYNKRAEMWFRMADWVKRGGALPDIPELATELTGITYSFHNGKFRLEEKDQFKKRIGRSPDYADALALTFALVDMPSQDLERNPMARMDQEGKGQTKHEWDPVEGAAS